LQVCRERETVSNRPDALDDTEGSQPLAGKLAAEARRKRKVLGGQEDKIIWSEVEVTTVAVGVARHVGVGITQGTVDRFIHSSPQAHHLLHSINRLATNC
jgi:hypothetical protein